jgi:hypothetical protein
VTEPKPLAVGDRVRKREILVVTELDVKYEGRAGMVFVDAAPESEWMSGRWLHESALERIDHAPPARTDLSKARAAARVTGHSWLRKLLAEALAAHDALAAERDAVRAELAQLRIDLADAYLRAEMACENAPVAQAKVDAVADPDEPDSECQACDGTGDENPASIDSDHCRVCRGTGRKWGSVIHSLTIEKDQLFRTIRTLTAERDVAMVEAERLAEVALLARSGLSRVCLLARTEKVEHEIARLNEKFEAIDRARLTGWEQGETPDQLKLAEEKAKRERLIAAVRHEIDKYPGGRLGRVTFDRIIADSEAAVEGLRSIPER